MKLDKETYKSYKAPISLFLGYIIGCLVCIGGLDYLRRLIMYFDFEAWIFNGVLRIILFLLAYILSFFVFWLFTIIFGYRSKTIYRGKGFYRFINFVTIVCPLSSVGLIIYFNVCDVTVNFHTFFNFVAITLIYFYPFIIRWVWYKGYFFVFKCGIRKCPNCGLINSLQKKESHAYYTGSTYMISNYTTIEKRDNYDFSTSYECSVCHTFDSIPT